MTWRAPSVSPWLLAALRAGVGYHHGQMAAKEKEVVEVGSDR
jgi:hypothetical protein